MQDTLVWLQHWYATHCDGDWEHLYGVEIGTLDNPGWRVKVNVQETELEGREFMDYWHEATEHNWMMCRVRDGVFEGAGGPHNLQEILVKFQEWADAGRTKDHGV
jgi:hypothetical protein